MTDAETLTSKEIETLRERLSERRCEVAAELEGTRGDDAPVAPDRAIGRLTRMDALQQQHLATARKQRLETQIAQIDQALARVRDGAYGECLRCEEPIALARLTAQPEAPFCLRCQRGAGA